MYKHKVCTKTFWKKKFWRTQWRYNWWFDVHKIGFEFDKSDANNNLHQNPDHEPINEIKSEKSDICQKNT